MKASTESAGATPYDALTGTATGVDATFELHTIAPESPDAPASRARSRRAVAADHDDHHDHATATTTVPSTLPDPANIPVPAITLSITIRRRR